MKAVAIKKGQTRERAPGFAEMGTLRCDDCGEEFIIAHDPTFLDRSVAERQAYWLVKVLAEEHERERKHSDRIQLPEQPTKPLQGQNVQWPDFNTYDFNRNPPYIFNAHAVRPAYSLLFSGKRL
jgi:hypothetical protein